jgi:glycosyltransferase involved in cell wall biosynthesis
MACGVPVITSNRGALPEVAGGAAVLVDPEDVDNMADAISALLDDEGHRSRLKDMGRQRSAEFSWRKTATETLALYRELF